MRNHLEKVKQLLAVKVKINLNYKYAKEEVYLVFTRVMNNGFTLFKNIIFHNISGLNLSVSNSKCSIN